jgi:two-component system, chemotaxis family, chemotaxis protein CheY
LLLSPRGRQNILDVALPEHHENGLPARSLLQQTTPQPIKSRPEHEEKQAPLVRSTGLTRMGGGTAMSILVVEDDDDLRELVKTMLEMESFHVRTAPHGRDALERVGERMPDLILLDMRMPVMDGPSFALEFRARHGGSVPIVVITAAQHAARRAREIGAAGWVAKPFGFDELVSAVRYHLPA